MRQLCGSILATWLVALTGCNLISGADALELKRDFGEDNNPDTPPPLPTDWVPVDGVSINSIAAYQSVKRPIMEAGGPVYEGVPLVEGKSALLRLFLSTDQSYNGQPVSVRLTVADQVQEVLGPLGSNSSEANLNSTVNFTIPENLVMTGVGFRVDLVQPPDQSSGGNPNARYPLDGGQQELPILTSGPSLRIRLVPIRYAADGSYRDPDTSPAQTDRYVAQFWGQYPARSISLTTGANVVWDHPVTADFYGWEDLLDHMVEVRAQRNIEPDVYLFGIFCPDSSFAAYCSNGCVTGLGWVPEPDNAALRVAIGIGFTGMESAETAAHEVGHLHGLQHAPCGDAADPDPNYPYSTGSIGTWGYDLVHGALKSPSVYADLMTYCYPTWVSDYHYLRLYDRIRYVNQVASYAASEPRWYERISIHADGSTHWLKPLELRAPPVSTPISVTLEIQGQPVEITGWFTPHSDGGGGVLLFPQPLVLPTTADMWIEGQRRTASRSQLTSHAPAPKRR